MQPTFAPLVLTLDGGDVPDKALIGGKAWSIAQMQALGLSVPPAFVITTRACREFFVHGKLSPEVVTQIGLAVEWLESRTRRTFGGGLSPLLVSVRSGAAISMPGMMDTVLNLGMNDVTEARLAAESGDAVFAHDTHRRFVDLYSRVVLKVTPPELAADADAVSWREAIAAAGGKAVPTNVHEQLLTAIIAVFESWNSPRARRYRSHHGISDDIGTAVTVQAMVFGNLDDRSGTGVLFTRNPITGEDQPLGEYLHRAQGEEVVSGSHTPKPLETMRESAGDALEELLLAARLLEKAHGDVQDIEFTVERGKLYLLQTRSAKRAPHAAVSIAVSMVAEGHIDAREALRRVTADQIRVLLRPKLADGATRGAKVLARGEAASPGIGSGTVVLTADEADARGRKGESLVLARATTSPNDLHGMIAARATITELGGTTSHAAVVARALGRPCVVGCGPSALQALAGRQVTVDGDSGLIYEGELPLEFRREESDPALRQLIAWASEHAPIRIESAPPPGVTVHDVDALIDADDAQAVHNIVSSVEKGACVGGAIFANSDDAVRGAMAAGAATIVTCPRLPALLAALHSHRPT